MVTQKDAATAGAKHEKELGLVTVRKHLPIPEALQAAILDAAVNAEPVTAGATPHTSRSPQHAEPTAQKA
jgi:hypothetical protein